MSTSYHYQGRRGRQSENSSHYVGSHGDEAFSVSTEDPNMIPLRHSSRSPYTPRSPPRPSHSIAQDNPSRDGYRRDRWKKDDSHGGGIVRYRKSNARQYDNRREDHYEHARAGGSSGLSNRDWRERNYHSSNRSERHWNRNISHVKGSDSWLDKDPSRRGEKTPAKEAEHDGHTTTSVKGNLDNNGSSRYRESSWKMRDKNPEEESRAESSTQGRTWTPGASWQAAERERLARQSKFDRHRHFKKNNIQVSDRYSRQHNQHGYSRQSLVREVREDPNNWDTFDRGRYSCL